MAHRQCPKVSLFSIFFVFLSMRCLFIFVKHSCLQSTWRHQAELQSFSRVQTCFFGLLRQLKQTFSWLCGDFTGQTHFCHQTDSTSKKTQSGTKLWLAFRRISSRQPGCLFESFFFFLRRTRPSSQAQYPCLFIFGRSPELFSSVYLVWRTSHRPKDLVRHRCLS